MKFARSQDSRGSALLYATIMVGVIFAVLIGLWIVAENEVKSSSYEYHRARARALAEGALEAAKRQILVNLSRFEGIPTVGSASIGEELVFYSIEAVCDDSGQPVVLFSSDPDGVLERCQPFRLVSEVFLRKKARVRVEKIVNLESTPLFQYLVFYRDDLEIFPGPEMTLEGRVQSNADIYLGCDSQLIIDSEHLRAQNIYLRRKDTSTPTAGAVSVKVRGEESFQTWPSLWDSASDDWAIRSLEIWKGTVKTAVHGVTACEPPSPEGILAFKPDGSKGYYHARADLVIKDNRAYANGIDVTAFLPPGTLCEKKFYDGREDEAVKVTEVSIGRLSTSPLFPSNGLIYAFRSDASEYHPHGIRLKDATEVKASLTVVSEDPVYIWGDFNTVEKKPCAIFTDAINLLSGAWDDSKVAGQLPVASDTTYNCAIVTGITPTGSFYSGGFENLPRLHEKWSGKKARICGAFACLFESRIGKAPWSYGEDNYEAPLREWSYESDFKDISKLPPWSPYVHSIRDVVFKLE